VLAYAGLRPQEALALPWHNVRDRTLLIDRAQSDEGPKTTKTGRTRSVRLLAPLAVDLAAWRLASKRSGADELVFPTTTGELWRDHDWRNWRRRVFDPLAADVGVSGMRPYDLRHAFCSLLIAEGLSVVEIARQAGHAPTMTLDTYAHVMADLDGSDRLSAEDAIRSACAQPRGFPRTLVGRLWRVCPRSVRCQRVAAIPRGGGPALAFDAGKRCCSRDSAVPLLRLEMFVLPRVFTCA
jgi:hypothetical protein